MNRLPYDKKEPLLALKDVSLRLDGKLILRDVNAGVDDICRPDAVQGQVVCFLGPSGIGKSRLSRIIAGLDKPTTGSVTLGSGHPVRRGLVGMVPQNYPLFEYTTVEKNFAIAGKMAGLSEPAIKAKQAPIIEMFGLQPYLQLYPAQLSGGTRQRVAILRQLMCSEHYIVLDEPFSGLDPRMKKRACELITNIAAMDSLNTIILVTHDVTEGISVADTVWLMGQEQDIRGNWIAGAKLIEQYDLASCGLCWQPNITHEPEFMAFVSDVKKRFETLAP